MIENFDFQELFSPNKLRVKTLKGDVVDYLNFDFAATTSPFLDVEKYVEEFFRYYGSVHRGSGQKSTYTTELYDSVRDRIRKYVKSDPSNYVIYSKNTTESINQAAHLWAQLPGRVLVSDIEHSSNLLPWVRHNKIVQYKTNQDGTVDLDEMEKILYEQSLLGTEDKIKLVTFTACSNISGYCPPIYKIAELTHKYGAMVFADLCQFIPHEKVDILPDTDKAHLDFIAFSGHKMYAPYGIGVLLGPKNFFDAQMPYHLGGGNLPYITRDLEIKRYYNERAHDPGTPNAVGPIALAKAMDIFDTIGHESISKYENELVRYTYSEMKKIPEIKLYVSEKLLGHVIPFDIEHFHPKLVATVLAHEYGIGLRAGAFCTYEYIRKIKMISDSEDKLIAAEVDKGLTRNIPQVVRVSLSICNTFLECKTLITTLKEIIILGEEHFKARYTQNVATGDWELCSRYKDSSIVMDKTVPLHMRSSVENLSMM